MHTPDNITCYKEHSNLQIVPDARKPWVHTHLTWGSGRHMTESFSHCNLHIVDFTLLTTQWAFFCDVADTVATGRCCEKPLRSYTPIIMLLQTPDIGNFIHTDHYTANNSHYTLHTVQFFRANIHCILPLSLWCSVCMLSRRHSPQSLTSHYLLYFISAVTETLSTLSFPSKTQSETLFLPSNCFFSFWQSKNKNAKGQLLTSFFK